MQPEPKRIKPARPVLLSRVYFRKDRPRPGLNCCIAGARICRRLTSTRQEQKAIYAGLEGRTNRTQKSGPKGPPFQRGELGRHHSGKAMLGNVPPCGTNGCRDRRKRVNFKDLVPLLVVWLLHFSFQKWSAAVQAKITLAKSLSAVTILLISRVRICIGRRIVAQGLAWRYIYLGSEILILSILLFDDLQLIEQRFVADLQNLGRLSAIPSGLRQYSLNGLTLG